MTVFILKRLLSGLILVLVVTAITFFLTYGAGLPVANTILGANASAEQVAQLNAELGLDQPLIEQYWSWLTCVLHGDLGTSYYTNEPVSEALLARLPVTLSVVVVACVLTIALSLVLGVASALRGGLVDAILQGVSTLAYVFPAIVLAIAMVVVFAINLEWVPAVGYVPLEDGLQPWFGSIILPAVVLTVGGVAALAAQIRGSVVDELSKDYVRTLRTRGMSEAVIVYQHVLRNAAGPGLLTFSVQFVSMFGASLFIERIFALPGYGTYAFNSATQGDLPAMLGVTLFGVGLVVVVNLLVDLATGWLNPKARTS